MRLTDLMPVASEAAKRLRAWPEHQMRRRIECVAGEVEVELVCDPRPALSALSLPTWTVPGLPPPKNTKAVLPATGHHPHAGLERLVHGAAFGDLQESPALGLV